HTGLFLEPDGPVANAVAHVIRRLRRVVTAVAAQTVRAAPITNVRAEQTGSDGVRTFDVMVGIRMEILPVLGKPSASRAVVGGTAVASRRGVTDVAKILVLYRTLRGRVASASATVFRAGAVQVVPDHVLNHVDAVRVQHRHHAQVGVLGPEWCRCASTLNFIAEIVMIERMDTE